jgi:hypothetical protein
MRLCCPHHHRYYDLLRLLCLAFRRFSVVALYLRLRGGLNRDEERSRLFRSVLCEHPALYTPSPVLDFARLVIHREPLAFAPILNARRDHRTPDSPSIAVRLKFTRLVKVHFRYGLHACARPPSGSGATFVRRCSRASVTFHAYAIATQLTNRVLRQDSHLQEN